MDVTASTITIVSSVWTLTVHAKQLISGIRNSDEKINALQQNAESFSRVVWHVANTYKAVPTGSDSVPTSAAEQKLKQDIEDELSLCKDKLKDLEAEVKKLNDERRSGLLARVVNSWKEKVAEPIFERAEKFITDHQKSLQSLLTVRSEQKLEGTQRKMDENQAELRQILDRQTDRLVAAMERLFGKSQTPAQNQTMTDEESSLEAGLVELRRQNTDSTLVNPDDGENEMRDHHDLENGNLETLHALAEAFFKLAIQTKSASPMPEKMAHFPSSNADGVFNTMGDERVPVFSMPDFRTGNPPGGKISSSPYKDKEMLDPLAPYHLTQTRSREVSSQSPLSNVPSRQRKETSSSGFTNSMTLVRTASSEAVASDGDFVRPSTQSSENSTQSGGFRSTSGGSGKPVFERATSSPEMRDRNGKTPLILASSLKEVDKVEKLLTEGADPHAFDHRRASALHHAAKSSSRDVMSLILKARRDSYTGSQGSGDELAINDTDEKGSTALHYCTRYRSAEDSMRETVQELINNQADINAKDIAGCPPLYYAMKHGRHSVVQVFLDHDVKLDFDYPKETPASIKALIDRHKRKRSPS